MLTIAWCTSLAGCARNCAVKAMESGQHGHYRLDCSDATVKRTGQTCGDGWEVVEITGCRTQTGELIGDAILVDTTTDKCFTRQRAGACFE